MLKVSISSHRLLAFRQLAVALSVYVSFGLSLSMAETPAPGLSSWGTPKLNVVVRRARETGPSRSKSDVWHGSPSPPLRKVIQIRNLTSKQAEQLVPIKLKGVVTDLSGYKNSFFFQDATGGISVDRIDSAEAVAGDIVEIVGTSGPGLFAPVVLASMVTITGRGHLPAAHRFMYGDLFGGSQDSQWVEIEGIVHSGRVEVVDEHSLVHIQLEIGGGSVNVLLQDFTGVDIAHLIDAKVRFSGVCATDFNQKKQFVGVDLYVPSRKFMKVIEPAGSDPFAVPDMPIGSVLRFGQARHRVKVSGVSTYQGSGKGIYLQSGQDGIRIQAATSQSIGTGRQVEAVGFPLPGEYGPILEDATLRDLGPAPPIIALRTEARNVITRDGDFYQVPYDQQLVQMKGTVEGNHVVGDKQILLLQDDNEVFEASFPLPPNGQRSEIGKGSVLLLTGICVVQADTDHNPVSFGLMLRSTRDVVVLNRPSWWTVSHTLAILAALVGPMIVTILWVVILRHRVKQQTQMIRESEGRFRNLAQNDHLTGLPNRLQLEEHINQCLEVCATKHIMAAIFTIDIDHFKQINDNYGHPVGDECLKIVASRLRASVRRTDVIARIGGEEFMFVAGSLQDTETARTIASAILELFQGTVAIQGFEIPLTVSIGGALYPVDGTDSTLLRSMSDQALYRAKESGRNRAVFISLDFCTPLPPEGRNEVR